jgi:hypothetical protein
MLLLEAMRALQLSAGQRQQLFPLARQVEERLGQLREEEESTTHLLEAAAQRSLEALRAGKPGDPDVQSAALVRWRAVEWQHAEAEEQVLRIVVPRLVQILSREQVLRAYLLTTGALPLASGSEASPALLDPGSGFAMDGLSRAEWQEASIRQALADRYAAPVLAALSGRSGELRAGGRSSAGATRVRTAGRVPVLPSHKASPTPSQLDSDELEEAMDDFLQLQQRWDNVPQWITDEATPEELGVLVLPFARRVLLSPRLKSVLTVKRLKPAPVR